MWRAVECEVARQLPVDRFSLDRERAVEVSGGGFVRVCDHLRVTVLPVRDGPFDVHIGKQGGRFPRRHDRTAQCSNNVGRSENPELGVTSYAAVIDQHA